MVFLLGSVIDIVYLIKLARRTSKIVINRGIVSSFMVYNKDPSSNQCKNVADKPTNL
ncbi:hypothetical protein [Saccharolobus caldissimus]|uniref:hypothetical protein n=1 Tax=Saccharolobus caldissimus TaxID=1702097 RepID=UPI001E5FA144|nr:hypothetical protein [Saccharolobus caldissimus]